MKWQGLILLILCAGSLAFADDPAAYEFNPEILPIDGYILFFNARGPASYVTSTLAELPAGAISTGVVHAQACQHGLSLPFTANLSSESGRVGGAIGNGGYVRALETLQKENPGLAGIYDVQVDLHQIEILTIYSKLCTEITARGYTLDEKKIALRAPENS